MKKIITVLLFLLGTEIECSFFFKKKDSEIQFGGTIGLKKFKEGVAQSIAAFEQANIERESKKKEAAGRDRSERSLEERAVRLKKLNAQKEENAQRRRDVIQRLEVDKKRKLSSIQEETEPKEHDEQENWDELYKKCAYGIIIAGGSYCLISVMSTYFSF